MLCLNNFFLNQKTSSSSSIKSYVIRRRKISEQKKTNILKIWKIYGINFNHVPLNFSLLFFKMQPVVIEIGFGDGQLFIKKVLKNPHVNFIGIEVYPNSVFAALLYADVYKISNLKIIFYDAVDVLIHMIPNHTISIFQIFFPDPWSKSRHHKRRLIKVNLIKLIKKKMIYQGFLHVVTDCPSYARSISSIMERYQTTFKRFFSAARMFPLLNYRDLTKFEKKSLIVKNSIFDYQYQYIQSSK